MCNSYEYQYAEYPLEGTNATLYVLSGGLGQQNPKGYMDGAVSEFLQRKGNPMYNEFIEIFLDNPFVRVIIVGINDLEYHNSCEL